MSELISIIQHQSVHHMLQKLEEALKTASSKELDELSLFGKTTLSLAVSNRQNKAVLILLAAGADVNNDCAMGNLS